MALEKYLKPVLFEQNKQVFVKIDPGTHFGYTATAQGEPERISGMPHAPIECHDWAALRVDVDTVIAKVLSAASDASPLKLPRPGAIDDRFWSKFRPLKALLMHPSLHSKFKVPLGPAILKHPAVEEGKLIVLGRAEDVGIWVQQGHRRNIVAHNKRGLTSVQFYTL